MPLQTRTPARLLTRPALPLCFPLPSPPATTAGVHFSGDSQAEWAAPDGLVARYRSSPSLYPPQQQRAPQRAASPQYPMSEPLMQPSAPGLEPPIGSRQGALLRSRSGSRAAPRGAAGAGTAAAAAPAVGQMRLPPAQLLDVDWTGGGLLPGDDAKGIGMDVSDLLEGFSADLEGLAVDNGTVVDGPLPAAPKW
jgi:hypothetical protein